MQKKGRNPRASKPTAPPLTISQVESRYPSWLDQSIARLTALCQSLRQESSSARIAETTSRGEFLVRSAAASAED